MLKLGNKSISNLFIGQKAATKAFLGQKLIWQKASGLPYDAEVEYLESTGTQWIDTGIRPAQNLSFAVEFNNLNANVGYGNVFGSRLASNDNEYQVTLYNGGSVGVGTRYSGLGFGANEINTIIYNGIDELNINGTVKKIVPQSCELAIGNILLFGISQNGVATQLANCRIYNVKFGNVLDLIPVRVGGVGYMYDRVSKQLFGNQGSGNFIVGPDVVEVEYLESQSTGGQYINTDYLFTSDNVEVTASLYSTQSSGQVLFGSEETISSKRTLTPLVYTDFGNMFSLFYAQNARVIRVNSLSAGNYDLTIKASNGTIQFSVNGTTTSASYSGECLKTLPIYLFAEGFTTNVSYYAKGMKLYGFTIKDNGVLVRDFVPVRVGMEGAMMDRLTRKIYRNAGTGAFKIGADKKETPLMCNSYVKDGLVAMWDGIENAEWGTHDANATTWKDLIGGNNLTIGSDSTKAHFTANSIWRNTTLGDLYTTSFITYPFTIEVLMDVSQDNTASSNPRFFSNTRSGDQAIRREFDCYSNGTAGSGPRVYPPLNTLSFGRNWYGKWSIVYSCSDSTHVTFSDNISNKSSSFTMTEKPSPLLFNVGAWAGTASAMLGDYYSIRIYSRALTAEEIAWNYEIDKRRFNLT